jgi:Sec-independent protein translocase protein TatA
MEVLGIGPLEFLLILVVALIVFGPKDVAKAGRTIGRFFRKVALSSGWQAVRRFWRELGQLPTELMREASLEETEKTLDPNGLFTEVKSLGEYGSTHPQPRNSSLPPRLAKVNSPASGNDLLFSWRNQTPPPILDPEPLESDTAAPDTGDFPQPNPEA